MQSLSIYCVLPILATVHAAIPICPGKPDGLYTDIYDCKKYYRCRERRQFHETCAPGTVFNPNTKTCDHLRNVPTCQGFTQSETGTCQDRVDGYFQNPSNCKSYFQCIDGKQIFYTCPEGTIFDESLETCNFPINVRQMCRMQ